MFSRRAAVRSGLSVAALSTLAFTPNLDLLAAQGNSAQWSERWRFDHGGLTDDELEFINYGRYLLRAPNRIMCVMDSDLSVSWDLDFDSYIDSLEFIPPAISPGLAALHIRSDQKSHIVDIKSGDVLSLDLLDYKSALLIHGDALIITISSRMGSFVRVKNIKSGDTYMEIDGYPQVFDDRIAAWDWNTNILSMYKINDGDLVWSIDSPQVNDMIYFNNVLTVLGTNAISGLSGNDGSQIWQLAIPYDVLTVEQTNGYIVLETNYVVMCIDIVSGETVWEVEIGVYQRQTLVIDHSDPMIQIELADGRLLVFSGLTGEILALGDLTRIWGSKLAVFQVDDRVIVIDQKEATITAEWTVPLGALMTGAAESRIIFGAESDIWVMDIDTGDVRSFTFGPGLLSAVFYRTALFVGYEGDRLEIYDIDSFEVIGESIISLYIERIEQEELFIINGGENVLVFDTESRKIAFEIARPGRYMGGVGSEIIFWVETDEHKDIVLMVAVDRSGTELWRIVPEEPIQEFFGKLDKSLFIDYRFVYELDTRTGEYSAVADILDNMWTTRMAVREESVMMTNLKETVMYSK